MTPAEKDLQHLSIYVNYRLRSVKKITQRCQRKFRLGKLIELPRVSFGKGETPECVTFSGKRKKGGNDNKK